MPEKPPELTGALMSPSGPTATDKPRKVAFDVSVSGTDVMVTVRDWDDNIFLGAVNIELYGSELSATVYDSRHEDDGDVTVLHDLDNDPLGFNDGVRAWDELPREAQVALAKEEQDETT